MGSRSLPWKLPVLLLCTIVAVSLSATGCGKKTVNPSASVYKIGAVLSLSGPAAPLGQPEQNSLLMLEEQLNAGEGVNGHKVQFIICLLYTSDAADDLL